jgi:hypothetical protein
MFGYCIWSKLHPNHYYNDLIKIVTNEFNLKQHPAHFTLKYNLSLLKGFMEIKNYYNSEYLFFPVNKIYQKSKDDFHALQLDFISNDINETLHISLAYRLDRPFTEEEVNFANDNYEDKLVYKKDYTNHIYYCNSVDSDKWFKIF